VFLGDKIRAGLVSHQSSNGLEFVKEFKSGRRSTFVEVSWSIPMAKARSRLPHSC
jgi:hypothetical protein